MASDCRTCKYNGTDEDKCYWCFRHDTELNQRYSKWHPKDDVPDTNVGDMISRQAAIDALKNRWKKTRNYEGNGDDIAEECELYLKQVPSAQPESCEGCKWENAFGYGECGRCRRRLEDMYERGTCENG